MPTVGYKKRSGRKAQGLEKRPTGKEERKSCLVLALKVEVAESCELGKTGRFS